MGLLDFLKSDPLEGFVPDDLEGLVDETPVDDTNVDDGDDSIHADTNGN